MDLHNADIRFMGLPAWALAVAGALCVALLIAYWRYLRRVAFPRPLFPVFLRFLALGLVLLLAANPALFITTKKPVPRRIAIMVDRSQSMSLADAPGGATRYERALAAGQSLRKSLNTARAWTFAFSGEGAPAGLSALAAQRPLGRTTFLMDSLDDPDTGEGLPLTDVVVVTDGRDNSGMAPAPPPRSARIHAVGLGAPGPDVNVSLGDVQAPEFAFVNKPVTLEGDVWLAGMAPGREITVELMSDDKRLAASTLKALGPDLSGHAWSLQFTPREVGLHTLTVRARAGDLAETVTQDNERPVFINVMSGRRKVLIVDTPRWDFTFLNRMLTAQDKIEINTLLFTDRGVQGNAPRSAMGSEARLAEYALVIFGAAGRAASQGERGALLTYLRRGGSVILLGGDNSLFDTPDTRWQAFIKRAAPSGANSGEAFYPALTPAGRDNPLLRVAADPGANAAHWAALPYLYTFHPLAAPQGAEVLAEHPWASCAGRKCPLIMALKADRGRLLMMPIQGLWRWRLARTEDTTFETLWNNILSVLMEPEETRPVRLVLPKRYYPLGGEICFEARIDPAAARAAAPTLSITQEDRTVASLPLNRKKDSGDFYTACFNPADPGIYKVEARAGGETSGAEPFAVTVAREEFVISSLNGKLLKTLAAQTGGTYVDEKRLSELADTLNKPGAYLDVREEHSLWRTPWCWCALGFIIGILSLEWILRRRGGLT
jgi:hypothetical protein